MGRTPRLSPADRLEYEHGVQVSQSTISRLLNRQRWSKKEVRRISLTQSRGAAALSRRDLSFPADLNLSLTRKLAGGIWHMRLLGMNILRLFGVERPGVS